MYSLAVTANVKRSMVGRFLETAAAISSKPGEPGCFRFSWHRGTDNQFVLFEKWFWRWSPIFGLRTPGRVQGV